MWVLNSLNRDDIKNQATTLAEIYSNQLLSLEIVDETLFLKDTYAANFKLSASPKNILVEMLEMSLIDLFPNISIALRIFLTLPVSVAEAERTFSLKKRVKNYLHSTMKQDRLNGIATLSINNEAGQIEWNSNARQGRQSWGCWGIATDVGQGRRGEVVDGSWNIIISYHV